MTYIILFALALSLYKIGVLVKHHISDDNIFAVIGDIVSIFVVVIVAAMVWFFF